MSLEAVIVPKISKLSWDMKRLGLSKDEVVERYLQEGVRVRSILESHERQAVSFKKITDTLPSAQIVDRPEFNEEVAKKFDVVITTGGDNHFIYVARYLDNQVMVGVNSDPLTSHGSLLNFTADDAEQINAFLQGEKFGIEKRTRLRVSLNGKSLPYLALSEVFVGESKNIGMSRHFLTYKGVEEEQKHSGLLIATGSGLNGWMRAVTAKWPREIMDCFPPFKKSEPKARFVVREIFKGCVDIGDINGKEELFISSLNDDSGIVALDCDPDDSRFSFPFSRGAEAIISIAEKQPLNVILNPKSWT